MPGRAYTMTMSMEIYHTILILYHIILYIIIYYILYIAYYILYIVYYILYIILYILYYIILVVWVGGFGGLGNCDFFDFCVVQTAHIVMYIYVYIYMYIFCIAVWLRCLRGSMLPLCKISPPLLAVPKATGRASQKQDSLMSSTVRLSFACLISSMPKASSISRRYRRQNSRYVLSPHVWQLRSKLSEATQQTEEKDQKPDKHKKSADDDKSRSSKAGFCRAMPPVSYGCQNQCSLDILLGEFVFYIGKGDYRRVHNWGYSFTSSTSQGGGGSFKDRIGEVSFCDAWMAKRTHWWIERWLRLSLSLTFSLCLSISASVYLFVYLSTVSLV